MQPLLATNLHCINMHRRCQADSSTTVSNALRGMYLLTTALRSMCSSSNWHPLRGMKHIQQIACTGHRAGLFILCILNRTRSTYILEVYTHTANTLPSLHLRLIIKKGKESRPCLVAPNSRIWHYAKRRFSVTSNLRYIHGVLNVDEIKN